MKTIFISGLFAMICIKGISQDINFSQFYEMPLLRNPALAGLYYGDFRATAAMRSQWASVSSMPYQTQALGTELKFPLSSYSNDYLAIGLQFTNDIAGDSRLGKTQVLPVVTFHKSLDDENDSYLSLGFIGGAVQQRFDPTKLKFDDQFVNGSYSATNPTQQTFNNTNVTYWDASVGMLYSNMIGGNVKFYLGAAYFHLTKPRVAFSEVNDIKLNAKIMGNGGLSAPMSDEDELILYADYFTQGGNSQGQGGFMWKHDLYQYDENDAISISAGSFLRWNDAVVPVIKFDHYTWGIGVTYDVNISKLKTASQMRGGFEVTLNYHNFLNMRNSSAQAVRCPVAF